MEQMYFIGALAFLALVLGVAVTMLAPMWNEFVANPQRARHLARRGLFGFIFDQVGGYVHDTAMTQYIPPTLANVVTGTWTYAAGAVAGTIARHVAATDETSVVTIPIIVPSNSVAQKGAYLKSIEIDYEILVAACDAVDAVVNLVTRGADGAAATVASQTFTYDTGHDTAAERYDVDQHKMTCTITTPFWVDNDQYVLLELTVNKAATTTFDLLGAFANFTLRI